MHFHLCIDAKFPAESGPTPTSADELTKALLSATRLQICQKGQVASCILKVTEIYPITGANEGLYGIPC